MKYDFYETTREYCDECGILLHHEDEFFHYICRDCMEKLDEKVGENDE